MVDKTFLGIAFLLFLTTLAVIGAGMYRVKLKHDLRVQCLQSDHPYAFCEED